MAEQSYTVRFQLLHSSTSSFNMFLFSCSFPRMPKCIHLHFENGLKSNKILFSDINGANGRHRVTQLLQYKKNPDHFVSWVKEHKGKTAFGFQLSDI